MPPPRLTQRQNAVYEFVRTYVRTHKKPPTLKEIGDALSIRSTNGVSKHLHALEKKDYIRRLPNEARGIELTEPVGGDEVPSLPLVSRTDSSKPNRLRRRPETYLYTDPFFIDDLEEDDCLIGRAGDDGMSGLGIFKGDYLVIEEQRWQKLDNGRVVAALVGDLLLARSFYRSRVSGQITLKPEDKSYEEQTFGPRDDGCHIIGPVLSVMRKL
jgi:repressor LexA